MSASVAAPPYPPSAVLTTKQVADWLNVHVRVVGGLGIRRCINSHKIVRYRASDVQQWLDQPRPPKPKRKRRKLA